MGYFQYFCQSDLTINLRASLYRSVLTLHIQRV
jgi:hypothetical protein